MAEDIKLNLKQNDVLIRYADEEMKYNIYHAVHDRVEQYQTKTAKGAAIVAACIITGVTTPTNKLTGIEPKGNK